jgi:putative addiction module component (TIGR02574 family)
MTSDRIVDELLALPLRERVALAQMLWQSINESSDLDAAEEERAALAEARRRDSELDSGIVNGRGHRQVMKAARPALG